MSTPKDSAAEEYGKALAAAYLKDMPDSDPQRAYYMGWCARGGFEKSNRKRAVQAVARNAFMAGKRGKS